MSGCSSGDCSSSSSSSMSSGCSSGDCSSSSSSMSSSGCSSGDCSSSSSMSSSGCSSGDCSGMMDSSSMMMDSTSTMMMDSTSTMMMDSTSTMMMESSSTMMTETAAATSTTAAMSYSTPSYGSGSSSWGSSECIASFGTPATYAPTATSGSSGSSGTGSTITVIVAPTQGVLRYVPFAVNASVGDTIKFMWGANNHTVTKSSELTPCNKTSDAPFASGTQNESFVFTQVVNDTNPTFFYCGTPTHCEKGMFGIINPPSALDAPTSVAGMMSSVIANVSIFISLPDLCSMLIPILVQDTSNNLATYASYTANQTSGSAGANWGANIDMSNMPSWAYDAVVENVMFTRNVLAMNPEIMNADGSVNLASIGSTPMMVPPDVGSALNAASSSSSSAASAASAASSGAASASSTNTPSGAAANNGAMSVTSSRALVGVMVVIATFFAL
ncbi:hypothetical protein EV360DRAFT_95006 [Lentinula raphanica]|nr:hypothetical protein EV360DRAFT_95006 [Lentinula raphanica]